MTDQGPSIANLMLDGIHDRNVRTPEIAALFSGLAGNGISHRPVFVEGQKFERAESHIRIANETKAPMHFEMSFRPNMIIPDPKRAEFDIPPHAEMEVGLTLVAPEPLKADLALPLVFDWTASYKLENRARPLERAGEHRIMLQPSFSCSRRATAVKIDGKLDEWKDLSIICAEPQQIHFNPDSWSGTKDGSFRFATAYDDKSLYIAIEATDDKVVAVPTSWPWFQDGVEVRLDARPEPERSAGRGQGEKDNFILIALSPGTTSKDMVFCDQDILPKGTEAICLKTPTGHITEIAIPFSYLDEKQKEEWKAFRLNIAVDDFDGEVGDREKAAQLWWRPDWRTPLSCGGSGTFRRK
ncbi:MAG: hypothetical protein HQ592_15955 [Planctomycetes bacterium]|nr:hypothetical protein [Planctomycetota bacterium]